MSVYTRVSLFFSNSPFWESKNAIAPFIIILQKSTIKNTYNLFFLFFINNSKISSVIFKLWTHGPFRPRFAHGILNIVIAAKGATWPPWETLIYKNVKKSKQEDFSVDLLQKPLFKNFSLNKTKYLLLGLEELPIWLLNLCRFPFDIWDEVQPK